MARKPSLRAIKRRGAITCKSPFRHDWDAVGPVPHRRTRRTFGTLVTFRCTHCGSYRFWVLSRLTGELLYSWYEHSDEYRELLDLRLSHNEWRAAWMDELDKLLLEDLAAKKGNP
ncbi:MAG TPA: hypothetical protein VIX41_11165 [Acidimicrobiales bacterium]